MMRERTSEAAAPGSAGPMQHWRYIVLHAVTAAAFIFLLQRYALNASLDTSLLWMLAFGAGAAGLVYRQTHR
jgi:hypothetical protein